VKNLGATVERTDSREGPRDAAIAHGRSRASDALDAAPDEVLAGRAADGDDRAFEVLVRRHAPYLRAFATRYLGSAADADDVVQDAFITAWRRLSDLEDLGRVRSWLSTIVARRATDLLRSRRPAAPLDEDTALVSRLGDPESGATVGDQLAALGRALAELPDDLRRAWLLREAAGSTYAEIATELDVPVATVRGRIARARAALLERMEDWR